MMTVWVLFEDFKEEAQIGFKPTIYLLLPSAQFLWNV